MNKVFIGGISAEGEHILQSYIDAFMPDAAIIPLQRVGIKSKIKRQGVSPEVVMIILDEILYSEVEGVAADVLALPKVHKYVDDDGLKQFLISKFGKLDISDDYVIPPDKLSNSVDVTFTDDVVASKDEEIVSQDDTYDDEKIVELQEKLTQSEALVKQLMKQIDDLQNSASEDSDNEVALLLNQNKSLAKEVETLKSQLELVDNSEDSATDSKLKSDLRTAREELADAQYQKSKIQITLDETTDELKNIQEEVSTVKQDKEDLTVKLQELETKYKEIEEQNKGYLDTINDNKTKLSELDILKEQVSSIDGLNSQINDLKDKLADKELEMQNLSVDYSNSTANATELQGKIEECNTLIKEKDDKIAEFETEISDKDSKLNELENSINELEEKNNKLVQDVEDKQNSIEKLQEDLSNVESRYTEELDGVSDKESQISELSDKLLDKESVIKSLSNELEQYKEELEQKKKELEESCDKLNIKSNDLNDLQTKYDNKLQEISDLDSKLNDLSGKIDEKNEEIERLRTSDVSDKLDSANTEIASLQKQLEDKGYELESLRNESKSKQDALDLLQEELKDKTSEVEDLTVKVEQLQSNLTSQTDSINSLQTDLDKLAAKDAEIEQLRDTLDEVNKSNKELDRTIKNKDTEIKKLTGDYEILQDELEVQKEANDKIIELKNKASSDLADSEKVQQELKDEIDNIKSQMSTDIAEKNNKISELETVLQKSKNKIANLESSVIDTKAQEETISRLEKDILEERRKSARANSELEILRKLSDGGNTDEIKEENRKLKLELEGLKAKESKVSKDAKSTEEVGKLQSTIAQLQEKLLDMQYELEERDEMAGGIFTDIANLALPKVAYDVAVSVPESKDIPQGFHCITCGSAESNMYLYSLLKRTCIANSDKRILIVDLVTDSTIDRDFGTKKVSTPINWLGGTEKFTNFLANTQYKNVKVLTTSLAYFNDLYLLEVDWKNRFKELEGYADIVFFNFGCLTNMVSKILFNSFSNVMKSYVVVKSSPLSLRTSILALTSIRRLSSNVEVECVNFNQKFSQPLYQKLTQKYKSRILNDTDVLDI